MPVIHDEYVKVLWFPRDDFVCAGNKGCTHEVFPLNTCLNMSTLFEKFVYFNQTIGESVEMYAFDDVNCLITTNVIESLITTNRVCHTLFDTPMRVSYSTNSHSVTDHCSFDGLSVISPTTVVIMMVLLLIIIFITFMLSHKKQYFTKKCIRDILQM